MSTATDNPDAAADTRTVEIVFPQHLNHQGTLFGGEALRMMDAAAFIAATRRARRTMVTAGVDHVAYEAPVHHGEIVEVAATVASVGRSSVAVDVEMTAEALLSGKRRRCGSGRFTLVAVDERERAVPVEGGEQ
jgi:acyl-CoA hydrolase